MVVGHVVADFSFVVGVLPLEFFVVLVVQLICFAFSLVANEFEVNDFVINLKVAFFQETIWLRCL